LARHDVVVIGTSSGGVEALVRLFGGLPEDLPAAVFIVVHFPQGALRGTPHRRERGPAPGNGWENGKGAPTLETVVKVILPVMPENTLHTFMHFVGRDFVE
jgi:hypothetical protein